MSRPDQSAYLAHFTKNGKEYNPEQDRTNLSIDQMSAFERLINILKEKKIHTTNMPWTNKKAVCFTECPWGSLLRHAENYSPYGIGFKKRFIYNRNGNPVIYANPNMFNEEEWGPHVLPFVTPFVPYYASEKIKNQEPFNGKFLDYSHEREWRVIRDLSFQYNNIQFVILGKVEDLEQIPEEIIKDIGIEKFLYMDVYRKIEELWPVHLME